MCKMLCVVKNTHTAHYPEHTILTLKRDSGSIVLSSFRFILRHGEGSWSKLMRRKIELNTPVLEEHFSEVQRDGASP